MEHRGGQISMFHILWLLIHLSIMLNIFVVGLVVYFAYIRYCIFMANQCLLYFQKYTMLNLNVINCGRLLAFYHRLNFILFH